MPLKKKGEELQKCCILFFWRATYRNLAKKFRQPPAAKTATIFLCRQKVFVIAVCRQKVLQHPVLNYINQVVTFLVIVLLVKISIYPFIRQKKN